MFQLQQVWTHSKGLLIRKERKRNTNMLQMQQERVYCQKVQKQTDDEEMKGAGGFRQRRQG